MENAGKASIYETRAKLRYQPAFHAWIIQTWDKPHLLRLIKLFEI